jgi:hypothetical protein
MLFLLLAQVRRCSLDVALIYVLIAFLMGFSSSFETNIAWGNRSIITVFFFLAAVSFLQSESKLQLAIAGLCLALTSFKPNVFLLLYLMFVLSSLAQGKILQVIAFGLGLAMTFLPSVFFRPSIIIDYLSVGSTTAYLYQTPTLGTILRLIGFNDSMAVTHFVPVILLSLGIVVSAAGRNLLKSVPTWKLLLLFSPLSLLFAPYAWTYDFILIPVGLSTMVLIHNDKSNFGICLLLLSALTCAELLLRFQSGHMFFTIWFVAVGALLVLGANRLFAPTSCVDHTNGLKQAAQKPQVNC